MEDRVPWISWRYVGLPLILVAISTALFLAFMREPLASDDCSYFECAAGLLNSYQRSNGQRLGLVYFIMFAQEVFGYNYLSYYFIPYFSYVGLILVIYFLGLKAVPPLVALLAGMWVAVDPALLINSSLLLPEVPSHFWYILGLLVLWPLLSDMQKDVPFGWRLLRCFVACVFFFLSAWTKETAVFMGVGLALFLLWNFRHSSARKTLGCLLLSALFIACAESLFYFLRFEDPLYRMNTVMKGHISNANKTWVGRGLVDLEMRWWGLPLRFFHFMLSIADINGDPLLGLTYFQWLFSLGPLALLLALWFKGTLFTLVSLTIITTTLLLSCLVVNTDPIIPLLRAKPRYFLLVSTLFSALIPMVAWRVYERMPKRFPWIRSGYLVAIICFGVGFPLFYINSFSEKFIFTSRNGANLTVRLGHISDELQQSKQPIQRIIGTHKIVRSPRFFLAEGEMADINKVKDNYQGGDLVIVANRYYQPPMGDYYWVSLGPSKFKKTPVDLIYAVSYEDDEKFGVPIETPRKEEIIGSELRGDGVLVARINPRVLQQRATDGRLAIELEIDAIENSLSEVTLDVQRKDSPKLDVYWMKPSFKDGRYILHALSDRLEFSRVKFVELRIAMKAANIGKVTKRRVWMVEPNFGKQDAFTMAGTPPRKSCPVLGMINPNLCPLLDHRAAFS